MNSAIDLTILIPVYNGATFLQGLLESFAAYIESDPSSQLFRERCEILVVNNRSEDATLDIANDYRRRIPNLRVITPETHVPSAEENVFRSFGLARGEYTWVLGCDDIVRFEALPDVIRIARERTYDIAIFNYMQSDKDGRVETVCNYYMRNAAYEGDLISLTQRLGYWWLIAGFSGQIVRTALVAGFDHTALVEETSPIYSHVTAYLLCLAGRRAAVINLQTVIYRLSDNDPDHWRRAAAKFGVFDEHFWTLGYIRQIRYLEERGIVARDFLVKMIESNRSGFFRPTLVIYDKLVTQLQLMSAARGRRDQRNVVSHEDFTELFDFFAKRDMLARPFLIACRQIFNMLQNGEFVSKQDFEDVRSRLDSYRASFLLSTNFVAIEGDYEIYRLANTFYAVHRCFRGAILDRLRYLDHAELAPIVLTSENTDELSNRISQLGVNDAWDNVPIPLMRYCSQPIHHASLAWHMPAPANNNAIYTPPSYGSALLCAQQELTATYKAKNSYLMRLGAWAAVLGLKVVKRLHANRLRYLNGLEGAQTHPIDSAESRKTAVARGDSKVA